MRTEAASATRQAVLAAARELFVAQGYGATTIDQIAARAGVSKPTVFAAVGNKRTVLKQVRDVAIAGDDEDVPVADRDDAQQVLDGQDAEEVLRRYAGLATSINDRYAEVSAVLHQAAGIEDGLRDLWLESEKQRRGGAEFAVAGVISKGDLRHDAHTSVDIVWTLTAPEHFLRLVRDRGWPRQRFESWLADSLCEQLLLR